MTLEVELMLNVHECGKRAVTIQTAEECWLFKQCTFNLSPLLQQDPLRRHLREEVPLQWLPALSKGASLLSDPSWACNKAARDKCSSVEQKYAPEWQRILHSSSGLTALTHI